MAALALLGGCATCTKFDALHLSTKTPSVYRVVTNGFWTPTIDLFLTSPEVSLWLQPCTGYPYGKDSICAVLMVQASHTVRFMSDRAVLSPQGPGKEEILPFEHTTFDVAGDVVGSDRQGQTRGVLTWSIYEAYKTGGEWQRFAMLPGPRIQPVTLVLPDLMVDGQVRRFPEISLDPVRTEQCSLRELM